MVTCFKSNIGKLSKSNKKKQTNLNDSMLCSYIIQHFHDTCRQSVIDLMQGNVKHGDELKFNEILLTLAQMADPTIAVSDYFHYGALNNELKLTESLITSSRCKKYILKLN